MKTLATLLLAAAALSAQQHPDSYWTEGLWQGYNGEWTHVSRQVIALAEATPADKFGYRPAPGVRTFSEVYMHIAMANFFLLSRTGPKVPPGMTQDLEKTVTDKAKVIDWLTKSFEAVRVERAKIKHEDFGRAVKVGNTDATVDGMYMRIIVHANEHMGQLIAYARSAGFAPPWTKGSE
jgi:uncharacterized damage-inducible protein DinB